MPQALPNSRPSDVYVEQGMVLLEGPDGAAMTMTPEAAEETGRRLIEAAATARSANGGQDGSAGSD